MASKRKNKKDKFTVAPSLIAGGVGTAAYIGSRSIDISDKSDPIQQRLIKAHKAKGTAIGFPTKPRAMLAKVIYDPKFKYYHRKSQIRNKPPGVLFTKMLANTEGGITINGPKLHAAYRKKLKRKAGFHKLPHIGEFFPHATSFQRVMRQHGGVKDIAKATDEEILQGVKNVEKSYGKFFYKERSSHSMKGLYGHGEDIAKGRRRVDIGLIDRLKNIDVKHEADPELLSKIRKGYKTLNISPDLGTGNKEYRLEIMGKKPTLIHRFGRKKGLKVNLDKELTSSGRAQLQDFSNKYIKFLDSQGAYSHIDEVPFAGADIIIPKKGKIKGVELA